MRSAAIRAGNGVACGIIRAWRGKSCYGGCASYDHGTAWANADPDPHADEGRHVFTYSLYPHRGNWREGSTVRRAYELNLPLLARYTEPHPGTRGGLYSLVRADADHVVVETVKGAEDVDSDGRRALVVRVYECYNQRGPVTLTFGAPILAATACNLVEEDDHPADFRGSELKFEITPYQIRTFRISLDRGR